MSPAPVVAIVPTVGHSPWLVSCLESLRADGGDRVEVVLVDQADEEIELERGLVDRRLRLPRDTGFAVANNRAIETTHSTYVATINDDVIIDAGWFDALCTELDRAPEVAAVQGTNRSIDDTHIDGRGIAWNQVWQAVQIDHGKPVNHHRDHTRRDVFGVSATAALYRRSALHEAADLCTEAVFEPRLWSYYEDVDLAVRLRATGHLARWVPTAGARHAGSTSGKRLPRGGASLIYGNRLLVLARLFGRGFWPRVPRILTRDLIDLGRALATGQIATATGITSGWCRAATRLGAFAHRGHPLLANVAIEHDRRAV